MTTALFVGLMSGTSMDGVDAAQCEFRHNKFCSVVATNHQPYPHDLRQRLLALQTGTVDHFTLREFAALDQEVARQFALAAQPLCESTPIAAIGSHGQTVFHDPDELKNSLQIGNPSLIAATAGIPVVTDFRRADLAIGGQGAPLVPAFHQAVFSSQNETRCVVNLGGIANISLLPGNQSPVLGWDTGPGNALMDEWIRRHHSLDFDANGDWAASGKVDAALLDALMSDAYFSRAYPKSTGRGYFKLSWIQNQYPALEMLPVADVQRTLCELTARTIANDILRANSRVPRVLVCGGGARNKLLISRLESLLPAAVVETTDAYGLNVDAVEAAAFAWLAMRRLAKLPGNLPEVTGARFATTLGAIYLPN